MRGLRNKSVAFVIMAALLWSIVVPVVSAQEKSKVVHYISLGDSLAVGVTPTNELGSGYADFASAALAEKDLLGSFTKEFAYPGLTSQKVLETLANPTLQEKLRTASVVTISSGANDFLSNVTMTENGPYFDMKKLPAIVSGIETNLGATIQAIHAINPEIDVYVMGYYFPYPHLPDEKKAPFVELSKGLNQVIKGTSEASGATFVPIFDAFGTNAKDFLPNPQNVHPNEAGYQVMAAALLGAIEENERPQEPEAPTAYTDLPEGHWAYEQIMFLSKLGVIKGATDSEFKPNIGMTRAEVAMVLMKLSGEAKPQSTDPGFKDVTKEHPAYQAITALTQKGVFSKAAYFNPNRTITRAELSKVVVRALELSQNSSNKVLYWDVPANYWGAVYINTLSRYGIVNGYTNGQFKPGAPINRAEFSVIAYRVLQMD
ncbi:MAG: S-layer homology domain-containing protein [Bacillota bacterium]